MKRALGIIVLLLCVFCLYAQENQVNTVNVDSSAKVYCNPKLEGMGPSKGVIISYQRLFNQDITSTSRSAEIGNSSGKILRTNALDVKLKIPFYNKPNLKLILGLNYEYQEFVFQSKDAEPRYDLYHNLQQKHLKTIGASIAGLKSLDETHYFAFQIKGDLNGDYSTKELPNSDFLKGSVYAMYGIKPCVTKTYGFGLAYSYIFGRQTVIPAFLYNNTFSKRWGVEFLLPAEAKLRYNFNRNTLLYVGAEVDGAAYNLVFNNPALSNVHNARLTKSALKGLIEFDREIHDWLWFGISGGISQPVGFNVRQKNDPRGGLSFKNGIHWNKSDPLIKNQLTAAPYMSFSLFVVPPRKLENKILYGRSN